MRHLRNPDYVDSDSYTKDLRLETLKGSIWGQALHGLTHQPLSMSHIILQRAEHTQIGAPDGLLTLTVFANRRCDCDPSFTGVVTLFLSREDTLRVVQGLQEMIFGEPSSVVN